MQRFLISTGLVIVAMGLLWPWFGKLPLGRLPGDIIVARPGFKLYLPITTMVLVSMLLSLLARIFRK